MATSMANGSGHHASPSRIVHSPMQSSPLRSSSARPLTKPGEVRQALLQLSAQSKQLDGDLDGLLQSAQEHTSRSRKSLSGIGRQVSLITDEASVLERRLKETGVTAERISESVRRLDEESERVEKASLWTTRVADLKASLQSMAASIDQRDYAAATQHCVRALSIDDDILHSNFAATMVPTSDYPEPPPVMLLNLRKSLLHVFTERFETATGAKDTVAATKYFTMFPQVGWTAEGLAVYAKFARSMVRERGKAISENLGGGRGLVPLHHAALLTHLFENLANLIDQHQPLVDLHYGTGNFAEGVMPELQEECDRLGKRVCDTWYDERYVRRKLEEAKSYTFTYVASIGTSTRKTGNAGQRAASGFSIPGRPSTPSVPSNAAEEGPQVDTREVDKIVGELAAMAARWSTYKRFLSVRLEHREAGLQAANATTDGSELKDFRRASLEGRRNSLLAVPSRRPSEQPSSHDEVRDSVELKLIQRSQLENRIGDLLESVYIPLESWFLRCSIEKAHRIDTPDLSARPLTTPLLDDVFYLVRLVLARAVSTSNLDVLSTMSRNVRYIIDEDFVQAVVRTLDSISRSSGGSMTVDGPRKDAASREMRTTFSVYLNVLSTSAEYTTRILIELSSEHSLEQQFSGTDIAVAASTIQGLSVLVPRIRNAVRTHMDLLFATLIRPRLRQLLSESLRDVSYVLNEEDYAQAEEESSSHGGSSLFVRRLTRGWENIIHSVGYRDLLTAENWEMLLRLAIDAIVQGWETWAMSVQYSELGALRFDKDVRTVSTFLVSQSATGGLRERFGRLTHISYLVNLDDDADEAHLHASDDAGRQADNHDDGGGGGSVRGTDDEIAWRLSTAEVRQMRQRRVGW